MMQKVPGLRLLRRLRKLVEGKIQKSKRDTTHQSPTHKCMTLLVSLMQITPKVCSLKICKKTCWSANPRTPRFLILKRDRKKDQRFLPQRLAAKSDVFKKIKSVANQNDPRITLQNTLVLCLNGAVTGFANVLLTLPVKRSISKRK